MASATNTVKTPNTHRKEIHHSCFVGNSAVLIRCQNVDPSNTATPDDQANATYKECQYG